jgi:nitrile hydratase
MSEPWRANQETPVLAVGTRVRARLGDPDHHTRVPRYVRGHTGEVVAVLGEWALPDDSVRGVTTIQTCYAVRFAASELWGSGVSEPWRANQETGHTVTVDLWEAYIERA